MVTIRALQPLRHNRGGPFISSIVVEYSCYPGVCHKSVKSACAFHILSLILAGIDCLECCVTFIEFHAHCIWCIVCLSPYIISTTLQFLQFIFVSLSLHTFQWVPLFVTLTFPFTLFLLCWNQSFQSYVRNLLFKSSSHYGPYNQQWSDLSVIIPLVIIRHSNYI